MSELLSIGNIYSNRDLLNDSDITKIEALNTWSNGIYFICSMLIDMVDSEHLLTCIKQIDKLPKYYQRGGQYMSSKDIITQLIEIDTVIKNERSPIDMLPEMLFSWYALWYIGTTVIIDIEKKSNSHYRGIIQDKTSPFDIPHHTSRR